MVCSKTCPHHQISVFVLHTVAHNPSGVDPTEEQWRQIANLCHKKNTIPIVDTAKPVDPDSGSTGLAGLGDW